MKESPQKPPQKKTKKKPQKFLPKILELQGSSTQKFHQINLSKKPTDSSIQVKLKTSIFSRHFKLTHLYHEKEIASHQVSKFP